MGHLGKLTLIILDGDSQVIRHFLTLSNPYYTYLLPMIRYPSAAFERGNKRIKCILCMLQRRDKWLLKTWWAKTVLFSQDLEHLPQNLSHNRCSLKK